MAIPTPHISAKLGDFAKTVLMPGDPKRAQFIAKNFLTDAVLVNDVRGVQGYTGYYKGKRVSVMASGMGQPSMAIYSYELFNFYEVDNIIRVGSCGAYHKDLHLKDIVIAQGACSSGVFALQYGLPAQFCPIADFDLMLSAVDECRRCGARFMVGNVYSSDVFYSQEEGVDKWISMGVLAVEMEAAALYCNAHRAGKKALAICSVSDSFIYPNEYMQADEREKSFTQMIEIALEIAR